MKKGNTYFRWCLRCQEKFNPTTRKSMVCNKCCNARWESKKNENKNKTKKDIK